MVDKINAMFPAQMEVVAMHVEEINPFGLQDKEPFAIG